MRHVVLPVLLRHVLQHLAASGIVEVHVDIRHGDAVGIEESLEQKVELERVDIRDAERIGDGRAGCGAASRPHPHAHIARGLDVVVHDEEVAGKSHLADRVQLELDALPLLVRQLLARPASLRALPYEVVQVVGLELDALLRGILERVVLRVRLAAELRRNGELRHDGLGVELVFLHLLGDGERVREELGMLGEDRRHLVGRLEPLLARVDEARAVRELFLRRKAEENVVRVVVVRVEEVHVVRGDDGDVQPRP